jgi:hypothetical protein
LEIYFSERERLLAARSFSKITKEAGNASSHLSKGGGHQNEE